MDLTSIKYRNIESWKLKVTVPEHKIQNTGALSGTETVTDWEEIKKQSSVPGKQTIQ